MSFLSSLPVLLYHYISPHKDSIAVSPERFDSQLQAMTRAGYQSISLDMARDFLVRGTPLPKKSVLLTFDDGFLDNWIYAYPLLKKHGHHAVIFAVTDKLESAATLFRPNLETVWDGKASPHDLMALLDSPLAKDELGFRKREDPFISWIEARAMEKSGFVSLAAHSARHESVYTGPEYSGLVVPGPRKRTFDRVAAPMMYGMPRFDHGPALAQPGFLPSREMLSILQLLVPQDRSEAHAYFQVPGNTEKIMRELANLGNNALGRFETDAEYQERVRDELNSCKEKLEYELDRKETTLAWPWGKYSPKALDIARDLGFTLFFATTVGANKPAANPEHVHRFKARDRSWAWLKSRLVTYSRPLLATAYAAVKK
ncbi:MAG: polysaccharide deacetylase [Desulfovibrio sp.]|nr:MAG: polysaccharide deacetylase [Desulfovibrio sp.]